MLCTACHRDLEPGARFCGLCGGAVHPLGGRYRLERRLAAGGFGTIYEATSLPTDERVAVKVLHPELACSEALAQRFRREGATLASLRHPHTLRTLEHGETADGTLYIAMELLRGESLRQRFDARGPLPWRDVVAILRAACLSLAEAHRRGIVHRDLTPSNLFLADEPRADFVKLLDFGVAGIVHGTANDFGQRLTRHGEVVGTLAYLSPEQSVGEACDARSDLYSLGVVAYELITGRRPFHDATTPLALITALHTEDPAPPSALRAGIPAELDAVLLRCLARDPAQRHPTAEALVDALEELSPALALGSSPEIPPALPRAALPARPSRSGQLSSLGETSPRLAAAQLCDHCLAHGPPLVADSLPGVTAPRLHAASLSLPATAPRLDAARATAPGPDAASLSSRGDEPAASLRLPALGSGRSRDSSLHLAAPPPGPAPTPARLPFAVRVVLCAVGLCGLGLVLGGGIALLAG
ncbi:MAG: protein kinase [Deltaproteobacteria bacterium]|nr:protein kinase [Deltaproteobacteria bacterium]